MKQYDIIIIGGGPAGLSAAIFALRGGCSVLLFEKEMLGGQSSLTNIISNYPGVKDISGAELSITMHSQAEELGLTTDYSSVETVDLDNKVISTKNGDFKAKCIILCMGAKSRKLNIENEELFTARGVHYCATCDGAFYKDKSVVVVGGGDSAAEEAIYLASICKSVAIINHGPKFKCQNYLLKSINQQIKNGKIVAYHNYEVEKIVADDRVKAVNIRDKFGKEKEINCSAVFVAIGRIPDNSLVLNQLELNDKGFIKVDGTMQTSKEAVFAAGDIVDKNLRQVITAAADGAIAGSSASRYINERR